MVVVGCLISMALPEPIVADVAEWFGLPTLVTAPVVANVATLSSF